MANDDLRRAMHEVIADMQADAGRADVREASGLIVDSYDPETGRHDYIGPFDKDTGAAWEYADKLQTLFNADNDGPDLECRVLLLFSPVPRRRDA